MRYRALDSNGDYQFGPGSSFLINTPQAVAQAILTRLRLIKGTWFLDTRVGFDTQQILGYNTQSTRDLEIQRVITGTPGVNSITSYSSSVDGRSMTVTATVDTIYGTTTISEVL